MDTDAYYHKTVPFRAGNNNLLFRTSQQLFSSHDIDIGTRFLLRTIMEGGYASFSNILDLGCGYGVLGLALKSLNPAALVHLVDRDALAVEYSRRNAALNNLDGVEIYSSLGYDDVPRRDFNLIVSNIPGKAGENVITYLMREARYFLAPGGMVAIVVVTPLQELTAKALAGTPGAQVILRRARAGHTVFHYCFSGDNAPPFPSPSAFERGIYHRQKISLRLDSLVCDLQTACGLPDFDSLSYAGEMLVKALVDLRRRSFKQVVAFNPGQGHVPVALDKLFYPQHITLLDRDLLALHYSRLNLVSNGCPPEHISVSHQEGVDLKDESKPDLFLGVLREDEPRDVTFLTLDRMAAQLSPGGWIILAAGSTMITRLEDYAKSQNLLRIRNRERRRGYSVLLLERV